MSKSIGNDRSRILLSDTKEIIAEKCAKALSDSQSNITYEPEKRPAISNLVSFAHIFKNILWVRFVLKALSCEEDRSCFSRDPILRKYDLRISYCWYQ